MNLATGALTPQGDLECSVSAAAANSDGLVFGISTNFAGGGGSPFGSDVVRFDPVSGICQVVFVAPEKLSTLAVAPDGTLVAQSDAEFFGKKQIYRFSAAGEVLSQQPLTGAVSSFGGFAYAPDGHIYGNGFHGWFRLNPDTGVATVVGNSTETMLSQVCIDSSGVAYAHTFGVLYRYKASTGAVLGTRTLERNLGLGAVVCR